MLTTLELVLLLDGDACDAGIAFARANPDPLKAIDLALAQSSPDPTDEVGLVDTTGKDRGVFLRWAASDPVVGWKEQVATRVRLKLSLAYTEACAEALRVWARSMLSTDPDDYEEVV